MAFEPFLRSLKSDPEITMNGFRVKGRPVDITDVSHHSGFLTLCAECGKRVSLAEPEALMSDEEFAEDFDKADMVLAEALQQFQASNVNPYVYGMALLEIGVAAMIKVGEAENDILDTVRKLDAKIRPEMVE